MVEQLARPGHSLVAGQLNVLDHASIDTCVVEVIGRDGRLDVLVSNAGTSNEDQRPSDVDPDLCERVWRINVAGA